MPKRVTLPAFDRLRRQIENLEWLLGKSGFDPELWKTQLSVQKEQGLALVQLTLRRPGRKILLSATADPGEESGAERHFWIDGNHWYDKFAISVLKDALGPTEDEEEILRLCDLSEDALCRVETGDDRELVRLIEKVRASCPRK